MWCIWENKDTKFWSENLIGMGNFKMDQEGIERESVELTNDRTLWQTYDHNIETLDSIKARDFFAS